MQADWDQMGSMRGGSLGTVTARGWLEHRSKIQNYPTSVRAAWSLAGVWDALRCERYAEARARCALAVCQWDQQSCDRGSWLIANELSLEDSPPYSAFAAHRALEPWEAPPLSPHRRPLAGALHGKAERDCRLPGQEGQVGRPCQRSPQGTARSQTQEAAKGRKGWEGGKRPSGPCSAMMDGGTGPGGDQSADGSGSSSSSACACSKSSSL